MDYHLHTNHSMDGRQIMPELCETMLARGVQEIALTEHIEPGHPEGEMDVPPVWADWFAEIARCRAAYPALVIRSGIEIGDNPLCRAETKALLDTLPLRLRTALQVSRKRPPAARIELPVGADPNGSFTIGDAQTYAVLLLDAICAAFDGLEL